MTRGEGPREFIGLILGYLFLGVAYVLCAIGLCAIFDLGVELFLKIFS